MHQPLKPPAGPYTIYLPMLSGVGSGSRDTIIDYEYDALYRLSSADYSSSEFFLYEYDAVGNRLSQQTEQTTNTYQYDAAQRLIDVDGVAYTWDDNGNLIDDGTRTFTYDSADRLIAVSDQGSDFSFSYDGLGNRYQQTIDNSTTTYALDLAAGLTQVLGDGSRNYTYGLGRIGREQGGAWQYPLSDALGSTRQLTNASADVSMAQSFEPFGAPMATAGSESSDFGFTGEQDAAGLVFLRARFYDPNVGRFLTKDPFPGFSSLPSTLHPYSYAMNNPVNLVDPSGQNPLLVAGGLGGLIGGIGGAIFHALANPCLSLVDMLTSIDFWRDVGTGALAGALAGLVGWTIPVLLPLGGTIWGARAISGLTSSFVGGTGQVVTNVLLGKDWKEGLGQAMIMSGIVGIVTGGIGWKLGTSDRNNLWRVLRKSEINKGNVAKGSFRVRGSETGLSVFRGPRWLVTRLVNKSTAFRDIGGFARLSREMLDESGLNVYPKRDLGLGSLLGRLHEEVLYDSVEMSKGAFDRLLISLIQ